MRWQRGLCFSIFNPIAAGVETILFIGNSARCMAKFRRHMNTLKKIGLRLAIKHDDDGECVWRHARGKHTGEIVGPFLAVAALVNNQALDDDDLVIVSSSAIWLKLDSIVDELSVNYWYSYVYENKLDAWIELRSTGGDCEIIHIYKFHETKRKHWWRIAEMIFEALARATVSISTISDRWTWLNSY